MFKVRVNLCKCLPTPTTQPLRTREGSHPDPEAQRVRLLQNLKWGRHRRFTVGKGNFERGEQLGQRQ